MSGLRVRRVVKISGSRQHQHKVKIPGISKSETVEYFGYALQKEFNSQEVKNKGQYVVLHHKIDIQKKWGKNGKN